MSLGETYVMRIHATRDPGVVRCVGIADTSLSLSLSLDFSPAGF
jgi:hypothetical protein